MYSGQARKTKVLFAIADVALTTVAFRLAFALRLALNGKLYFQFDIPDRPLVFGFCALIWVLSGWWLDVYGKLGRARKRVIVFDALRQCLLGSVCLLIFEFLLRLELSRLFIALFAMLSVVLLVLYRLAGLRLSGTFRRLSKRFVLVVGHGARAERMGRMLEHAAEDGIELSGFIATSPHHPGVFDLERSYPVYGLDRLPELMRRHIIDEIIFAVESPELADLEGVFLLCDEEGVRTRVAVDFFPHVNSQIRLEHLGETQLLTFSAAPDDDLRLLGKRALDVGLALGGFVVALPLLAAIALVVKITSRGPVIFRQERCGLNGRTFRCYKFRSMIEDAETRMHEVAHLSSRATAPKIPNDPRLTPIGRHLRRFSLDELPQLVNVIRGEMSLVGPRPAIPSEVAQYQQWQRRRLRMRPGMTCLWAVNGRDRIDFDTWMKLDLQYIDNWSLALDCKILLQTIPHVLTGRNAS